MLLLLPACALCASELPNDYGASTAELEWLQKVGKALKRLSIRKKNVEERMKEFRKNERSYLFPFVIKSCKVENAKPRGMKPSSSPTPSLKHSLPQMKV